MDQALEGSAGLGWTAGLESNICRYLGLLAHIEMYMSNVACVPDFFTRLLMCSL